MSIKAKERRAILDQTLSVRASTAPAERPIGQPRQLGPIAEQANLYAEHVATRAKLYDQAKAEGRLLLELDPKKIRATEFRNRHERSLLADDPKFIDLKASLHTHGQEIPIRVRPVKNALPFEFEIVAGHRRHAACLALDAESPPGFPVLALVDAGVADARDLVLKMYRENEERYDLSAFEKGRMFTRWLEANLYESQRELAAAIGLGETAVAKYLSVAALPPAVLAAFGDERVIPMSWGPTLSQALKANEAAVLRAAERLAQRKPLANADVVLRTLSAAAAGKSAPAHGSSREESVRIGGRVPLKVGSGRNRIVLKLQHVDEAMQKQMREELKDWAEAWLRKRLDGP
ncbi:MAG TPA: ParB/RepB/Spo0J family partition protein [Steroidobacteraceae bacterium]